jgi:hypothetical protein
MSPHPPSASLRLCEAGLQRPDHQEVPHSGRSGWWDLSTLCDPILANLGSSSVGIGERLQAITLEARCQSQQAGVALGNFPLLAMTLGQINNLSVPQGVCVCHWEWNTGPQTC